MSVQKIFQPGGNSNVVEDFSYQLWFDGCKYQLILRQFTKCATIKALIDTDRSSNTM